MAHKLNLKPVNEQVIVITGASSGIGLSTAHAAAQQGAKLVLAARSDQTLNDIVQQLRTNGTQAIAVGADVGNRADVEKIVEAAVQTFGRIDTWVNDAGISIYGKLEDVADEDSRKLFDTNFWGVVYGSLVALPYLKQSGGALINIGSEVSDAYVPLLGMYSASKHAVKGFTDSLRLELELEEAPVSVTLIQPTAVDTPFPQHGKNYMDREANLPHPRIDPEDVAKAILDAAANPRRDVRVGLMAKINTTAATLMPSVADAFAKKQAKMLSTDAPPRNPEGALHDASEKSSYAGQTHGTKQPSEYKS
jgi:short-subunit dehydrogenase